MKFRTAERARVLRGLRLPMHTVRPRAGRGKRSIGQFAQSARERAMEVILRVRMTTRKARAAATKHIGNLLQGCPASQQLFGNPLVGDAPIWMRESLWNPQPLQPALVNAGGLGGSTRWEDHFAGERPWPRSRSGDDASATPDLAFHSLDQRRAIGRQAHLRMQQPHPGSVPVALAPSGFLVVNPASRPR